MYKKDFLVRQFEEFGKVLAVILNFKKNQDWEKFEKEVYEASLRFTSFDLHTAETMTQEEFEHKVVYSETLLPVQKKILASLLFEKMEYYASIQQQEKYSVLLTKCLALYKFLHEDLTENEFDLEIHFRRQMLEALCNDQRETS